MRMKHLCVAIGLLISPLMINAAEQQPLELSFQNNDQLRVTLSSSDLNKILIEGDRITAVDGIKGSYSAKDTSDGGVLISPSPLPKGGSKSLYIETEFGRAVSLKFSTTTVPGRTYKLQAKSPVRVLNEPAKTWEEESPYISIITDLFRTVMSGRVPENYIDVQVDSQFLKPSRQPYLPFELTRKRILVGFHMAMTEFQVKNMSQLKLNLPVDKFYIPGVKAAAASTKSMEGKGVATLWVLTNADETEGLSKK